MNYDKFIDAQKMARKHPSTFEAPSFSELERIKPSDWVKICVANLERFWVIVLSVNDEHITGTIDNHLIHTDIHELKYGDVVAFEKKHIYAIHFLQGLLAKQHLLEKEKVKQHEFGVE